MKLIFRVPAEHQPQTAAELMRRAWPGATPGQISRAFEQKKVRIAERITRNPAKIISADVEVSAEVEPGEEVFGFGDAAGLARGDDWIIVDKPVGMPGRLDREDPMNPILFLADTLGVDRETFSPVWQMPAACGGPWLFGLSPQAASALLEQWGRGQLMITWAVLVPAPPRPQGRWVGAHQIPVDYSATQIRHGLAELQLTPMPQEGAFDAVPDPVGWVLDVLAAHQVPALGDAQRGGFMVPGGLRLRAAAFYYLGEPSGESADSAAGGDLAHSWNAGEGWWPREPVVWESEEDEEDAQPRDGEGALSKGAQVSIGELTISKKSFDIVQRTGHPWVYSDRNADPLGAFDSGDLVHLVDSAGRGGPWALVEGHGKVAARVWSREEGAARFFGDEVDIRVDEAIARRGALTKNTQKTDLFRLIHGEADGLPGLFLDRVGPLLRATVMGGCALGFRERVYKNILDFDPEMMILEVEHLRDIRANNDSVVRDRRARVIEQGAQYIRQGERVVGVEDGLKYWCEPWEGIDVGFFADQRENRRQLRQLAASGQRWLNLFCHTGAFSVLLAAMGCEVVSVDLSRRYLEWLEQNMALNRLDPALNQSIADDARAYLSGRAARSAEVFDGMIVDPPTAAAGSAGFWSVKKDYEDLLTQCFGRLAAGGVMLVCRNDKRPTDSLEALVRRAAKRAGRKLSAVDDAPPAPDYPRMAGFPEGDSFEGLWVRASG